jgi:hypothetical protein
VNVAGIRREEWIEAVTFRRLVDYAADVSENVQRAETPLATHMLPLPLGELLGLIDDLE